MQNNYLNFSRIYSNVRSEIIQTCNDVHPSFKKSIPWLFVAYAFKALGEQVLIMPSHKLALFSSRILLGGEFCATFMFAIALLKGANPNLNVFGMDLSEKISLKKSEFEKIKNDIAVLQTKNQEAMVLKVFLEEQNKKLEEENQRLKDLISTVKSCFNSNLDPPQQLLSLTHKC